MSSSEQRNRKRGVRASRAKLYHALTAAGFKTQAALAEHMADIEQLDAAPKDIVNRVFRELPVEAQTLERIARALNTEAFRLYKTQDEPEPDTSLVEEQEPMERAAPGSVPQVAKSRRTVWLAACLVVLVVSISAAYLLQPQLTSGEVPMKSEPAPVVLDLGDASVLVMPIADDEDAAIAQALRAELGHSFKVASDTASVVTDAMDPAEAAQLLRTDVSIDTDLVIAGRHMAVRFYLFARGERQQIWADAFPQAERAARLPELVAQTALAVRRAVGLPVPEAAAQQHYPLAPVQDHYLQGLVLLDGPASELNIRRAQASFNAALRQDANFAQAHAGLCETLLLEHWMSDEQRALTDAAQTCAQALQLNPDDPVVGAAYAHFLRLTGRLQESIEQYQQILARRPDDASARYGLAETRLLAARQDNDDAQLQLAMADARAAADSDPSFWKPLYLLAPMHYYAGDVAQAIAVSEEALQRDVNEYVLANLGTFQFCAGQYEAARDNYLRARDIAPQSYVGNEFLGMVYYFLGDFETSADLRSKAIASVASGTPEIHEMWGNLADSYYQAGELPKAEKAYLQAAEIVERDFLRGTATESAQASRAYYYIMIEKLLPGRVPPTVRQSVLAELEAVSESITESNALLRVSQAWMQLQHPVKAQQSLDKITVRCKGYAAMPDLVGLPSQQTAGSK